MKELKTDITTKSVYFNLKDEYQKAIYEHADNKKVTFSSYVKRLIEEDMRKKKKK